MESSTGQRNGSLVGVNPDKPEVEVGGRRVKLEDVLPKDQPYWWNVKHLVLLNLCITIPMVANSSNGYDGALLNGLQSLPQWRDYYDSPSGAVLGALSTAYTFGNFIAFPVCAYFNDRWGRLGGLRVGCAINIVGAILQCASQHYAMFFVARTIIGFGSVVAIVGGPTLVAELAFPTHRGIVTALFGPSWYFGAFIAAWVTYGSYTMGGSWSWRLPSLLQGLIPAIQIIGSFFIPESPRWLVFRGREEEARQMLAKYHGGHKPAYNDLVDFELAEIKTQLGAEAVAKEVSYKAFFSTKPNRWRLFVILATGFTGQLAGNGLVSYYLNLILNSIGITEAREQLLINGALMGYNIGTAVAAGFLVGKLRRRTTFLTGLAWMLVCYICWTALSAVNQQRNFEQESLGRAVLAFIFLYYMGYNFALNALPNLYLTEILPYYLRAKGTTIYQCWQGLVLVYNGFVNPVAMDAISWRYYIVFCCLLALEFTVIYFTFPETFGMTLEETSQVFGDGALNAEHADASPERKDPSQPGAAHVDETNGATQEKDIDGRTL